MSDSDDAAAGWAVAMTKPACEEIAERSIRQGGHRCYLPRFRKLLRGSRIENGKRIRTRQAGDLVMRPLFPGYILIEVHAGDGAGAIDRVTGVVRVLRHRAAADGSARPRLIAAELVDAIRKREQAGHFDEGRIGEGGTVRKDIAAGDRVQIGGGEYSGLIGRLVELDEAGRAAVLLEILGRSDVRASVPAELLRKLA